MSRDSLLFRAAARPLLTGASTFAMALLLPSAAIAQDAPEQSPDAPNAVEAAPDQPAALAPAGPVTADDASVEAIVVTGTRLSGGFTSPTPVTVLGEERLERLNVSNIGDALVQVPGFRPSTSPTVSGLTLGTIGSRIVDLRGLGPTRTLVLVNGRRFVPSTSQGTMDLNNIPVLLVKRTEVVTGGASAAYGSDAVAGVVNIVLDEDLEGLRLTGQFGISRSGDGEDVLFAGAWGTGFAQGRGHIVVGGEFQDSSAVGDCYTRAWCREERQVVTNATPGLNGLPAQVIATNVHASTQTRGGLITAGPLRGIQFAPDGTPIPFIYGELAGNLFQIGGSGAGENPYFTGVYSKVPVRRYSTYLHGSYDFSDSVSGFLDASYSYVDGRNLAGATRDAGNLTIQIDNAFLPASIRQAMIDNNITNFRFGRDGTDLGFIEGRNVTKTFRVAAGLSGDLGGGWRWDAYYQYGRSDFRQTVENNRINANFLRAIDAVAGPNGTIVCRSTLTDPGNGCSPLNPFGQYRWSQDAKNYAYGTAVQTRVIDEHVAAANIQGAPFSTWAGPVAVAAGIEYRNDRVEGDADDISKQLGFYVGNGSSIDGEIGVWEGYVEANIPLLRDSPLGRSFEINAAARLTDYTTSGRVTTWKVGAVYEPTEWLRLRATRSRDIRAPNLNELFAAFTQVTAQITDTATASQGVFNVRSSGNADLTPERADTLTAGIVLRPGGWLRGLQISVDYFDIQVNDAISALAPQNVVTQCNRGNSFYCQFVERGSDGRISLILTPFLNLNVVETNGLDIEAQYSLPLDRVVSGANGRLIFNLLGTYVAHLRTIQDTGSIDVAGVTGCAVTASFSCVPHWVLDGTATYSSGPFAVTLNGHYIPRSVYDPTLVGPEDPGYAPNLPNSINTNRVDDGFFASINVQYDILSRGDRSVQLFGGIDNIFGQHPPRQQAGRGSAVYFDPVGTYFKAGVRIRM